MTNSVPGPLRVERAMSADVRHPTDPAPPLVREPGQPPAQGRVQDPFNRGVLVRDRRAVPVSTGNNSTARTALDSRGAHAVPPDRRPAPPRLACRRLWMDR